MSKVVDERVVEMRFDNKQFESASKQTLGTLDKLKQGLDFSKSEESLRDLQRQASNIDLTNMARSVEYLAHRFSFFGETSRKAVNKVRDTLVGDLYKAINFVSNAIVERGKTRAMNIENAHFQLQALLKDEKKVQEVMDNASSAVAGTAYGFDEAAKAASQFAASGIEAGEEMTNALRGIVGVSAMTNSQFEDISRIFTAVAGQGRLMGDQLLQLSGRGLNAAVTIAEFVNGVIDGSKEASVEVTSSIAALTGGLKVTEGEIRDFTSKGKISFKLFSEAMTEAFADSAERANETFQGAFGNMRFALAKIGAEFYSPLIAQNSELVNLFNALRIKINEIKAVVTFDKEIGNVNALSKRFTDAVLSMAKAATKFVQELDLEKPLKIFDHWVNIVANSLTNTINIIKSIGRALANAFVGYSIDDLVNISSNIEKLTEKLKLNRRELGAIYTAFKGVADVAKLFIDIVVQLIGAIIPGVDSAKDFVHVILALARAFGQALSSIVSFIRQSGAVEAVFKAIGAVVNTLYTVVSLLVLSFVDLVYSISQLQIVQDILKWFETQIQSIGEIGNNVFNKLSEKIESFIKLVRAKVPNTANVFKLLGGAIVVLLEKLNLINTEKVILNIDNLKDSLKKLADVIVKVVMSPIVTLQKAISFLRDVFNFDKAISQIERLRDSLSKLVNWIKNVFTKVFSDVSIGGLISGGIGVGVIYSIMKLADAIISMVKAVSKIPKEFAKTLTSVRKALNAYAFDLQAAAIVKVAIAIGILAASLTLLGQLNTGKIIASAVALSVLSGILFAGFTSILIAANKAKTAADVLFQVTNKIGKALNNLAKAKKWENISSTFKNIGVMILSIAGSLAAIALLYERDGASVNKAINILADIGLAIAALIGVMSTLGEIYTEGMKNFSKILDSLKGFVLSLSLLVGTLLILLSIDLPKDHQVRLGILAEVAAGLLVVCFALSKLYVPTSSANKVIPSLLALVISLSMVVRSLERLMAIELPGREELITKLTILGSLFAALIALFYMVADAGHIAGGSIKATGTILAMCAFLGTAVAALAILTVLPGDRLMHGAEALGLVLVGLAVALSKTSKIANAASAASVLAMAVATASITLSLGILSMINWTDLLKATVALGGALYATAKALEEASKATSPASWGSVAVMVVETIVIVTALGKLVMYPWQNMLASAVALGGVLLAMSRAMNIIESTRTNPTSLGQYIAGLAMVGVIAFSLFELAKHPWQNLLAAAASISLVMLAMGAVLGICTAVGSVAPAAQLGLGLLAEFLIGFSVVLSVLGALYSNEKVQNIVNNGVAFFGKLGDAIGAFIGNILSSAMLSISSAMPQVGEDLRVFAEKVDPFLDTMAKVKEEHLDGVIRIAEMVVAITAADVVKGIASWIPGTSGLSGFGEELKAFGADMAEFSDIVKNVDVKGVTGAATAAQMMSVMKRTLPDTNGLVQVIFGSKNLSEFGQELVTFGPLIAKFANDVRGVEASAVQGAASAAQMMAELANKLPTTGGLEKLIFGKKSISHFGKELESFGPHIKSFADSVSGIRTDSVQGAIYAAQMMAEIANRLPKTGGLKNLFSGDNDLASFGKKLVSFGQSMAAYSSELSKVNYSSVESSIEAVGDLVEMSRDIKNFENTAVEDFAKSLKKMANNGIDDFCKAFSNSTQKVRLAVDKFIETILNVITTRDSDFEKQGSSSINAFIKGMSNAIESGKKKLKNQTKDIGKMLAEGVKEGVNKNLGTVEDSATEMGNHLNDAFRESLGIHSPSDKRIEDMYQNAMGVVQGLDQYQDIINQAMYNAGAEANDQFTEGADYPGMITDFWNFANGVELVLNKAKTMMSENNSIIGDGIAEREQKIIAHNRFALNSALSNFQELSGVEKSRNSSAKAAAEEREEIQQEEINAENVYWATLLAIKKTGMEKEMYEKTTVADFMEDVLQRTTELVNNYKDTLQQTTDQIFSSLGLFDEVQEQAYVDSDDLFENLNDQVDLYDEYVNALQEIDRRLGDSPLGQYLKQFGIDSLAELQAINSMSDTELSRYAMLYDDKMGLAAKAAELQLTSLKTDTESQLNELFNSMTQSVELYDFMSVFDGSIESINSYVNEIIVPMNNLVTSMTETAQGLGQKVKEAIEGGFAEQDMSSAITEPVNTALEAVKTAEETPAQEAGKSIGSFLTQGINEAISNAEGADESAKALIDALTEYLKSAGEIHSPSELMKREVGANLVAGVLLPFETDEEGKITSSISSFVDNIVSAFPNQNEKLITTGNTLVDTLLTGISGKDADMKTSGNNSAEQYNQGIKDKFEITKETGDTLAKHAVEAAGSETRIKEFKDKGTKSAEDYNQGIKDKFNEATKVGEDLSKTVSKAAGTNQRLDEFKDTGSNSTKSYIQGIHDIFNDLKETGIKIASKVIEGIKQEIDNENLRSTGKNLATAINNGILDMKGDAKSSGETLATSAVTGLRGSDSEDTGYSGFTTAGQNAIKAFINGMRSKIEDAAKAAAEIARAAYEEAMDELDENSPSKKMWWVGRFAGIGFVEGMKPAVAEAAKEGEEIGKSAYNGLNDGFKNLNQEMTLDFSDPVIRPVVDMSNVEASAQEVQDMFNASIAATANRTYSTGSSIDYRRERRDQSAYYEEDTNTRGEQKETPTFIQNNYSPKALSASEIYRQTRNLISQSKARSFK